MYTPVSESAPKSRKTYILLALSLTGLLDALYLTYLHYTTIGGCTLFGECEAVLTSEYATTVGGLPISLLGAVYYATLLLLGGLLLMRHNTHFRLVNFTRRNALNFFVIVSGLGFFITLALIYLQIAVIQTLCQYCLLSALTTTLAFIISTSTLGEKHGSAHKKLPDAQREET